jgi:VWFA-related protein
MPTSVGHDSPTTRGKVIAAGVCLTVALGLGMQDVGEQPPGVNAPAPPVATFRSSVDLVRVAAVVRDHKGRLVPDLAARDFEILENGASRPIAEFQHDLTGVSLALLFDVSGSMEAAIVPAREAAMHVLSWLDAGLDEAAVYMFDTRLVEVAPFTTGLKALPPSMSSVVPFGETSLHDAIASTAEQVGARKGRARAVVVFTDGNDNASHLQPAQVSAMASAIDVPVYVFAVVASIDNPSAETSTTAGRSALEGPLSNLAAWTGGHVFVASTPGERSIAARQILDELRHQYLIAFESSATPGWHSLEVRARSKGLTVRARSGYIAGQSRPVSR